MYEVTFFKYLCIKVYWPSFSAIVTEVQILLIECNWQDVRKIEIQGTWMFQIKWRQWTLCIEYINNSYVYRGTQLS